MFSSLLYFLKMSDGSKNKRKEMMHFTIHNRKCIFIYSRDVIIFVALFQEVALSKCFS